MTKFIKTITIAFWTAFLLPGMATADDAPGKMEALKMAEGLATFTADGVNLRMNPSANAPYLVYFSGEELYYEPQNVQWSSQLGGMHIGGKLVQPDHEKIQGRKDMQMPVLGSDGDWIKLYFSNGNNPFVVWTMKKFVKVVPLVAPTSASTFTLSGYNAVCLTDDADGSPAILYQEPGMDEDEGFFIGKKEGNAIVFDQFMPVHIEYDPSKQGVELSKDPDIGLIFTFGANSKAGDSEYPVLDVKGFSAENIKALLPLCKQLPQEEIVVLIATTNGLIML